MTLTPLFPTVSAGRGSEISRLLTAAVVNRGFCTLLLTNPARALASGYKGEAFRLGAEEQDLVLSIRAKSLDDFARQLTAYKSASGTSRVEQKIKPYKKRTMMS
jgi:hypothetical protein